MSTNSREVVYERDLQAATSSTDSRWLPGAGPLLKRGVEGSYCEEKSDTTCQIPDDSRPNRSKRICLEQDLSGNGSTPSSETEDLRKVYAAIAEGSKEAMERSDDSAELYSAAAQGDIKSAEKLIDFYGLSHRPGWAQGYHLLRTVLKNNHSAVAILLLARGCSVRSETRTDAPLHLAARNGDLEIVRLLLEMGADVNARKKMDATPLHIAIYMNFEEIAELLIIEGADINATTKSGITPLHVALNESEKIAKMLIERGADINARKENDLTPLHIALNNDLEEIAELLITNGADITARTKRGLTPLHVSLKKDKGRIERLLIERGADTNARTADRDLTPLQIATKTQSWDIVNLLLRHGASVQEQDRITIVDLNLAVAKGSLPMSDGLSPLCDAIGKGDLETTRQLLKNGANVKDFPGLLHVAIEKNCIEIVRELLCNGIDVNVGDKCGWTGLHVAIKKNYIEIVRELLFND